MRTEREQVAARIRAEGDQKAREIRAGADRERAQILAQAYGTDPDFASFYRSMLAYEKAIGPGTTIVMSPQGDFFRYFDSRRGAGGGGGGQ
jgi:membrane protease subunit HflC